MSEINTEAAVKHYLALKSAQKRYYDRKHPVETRRPRGRPRIATVPIPDPTLLQEITTPTYSVEPPTLIDTLLKMYEITKNADDFVSSRELTKYLRDNGVQGSLQFINEQLTHLTSPHTSRYINGLSKYVRVGLRKRSATITVEVVKNTLLKAYDITNDPNDVVPTRELIEYLRNNGVQGGDCLIGCCLSRFLAPKDKKMGGKSVVVRVGIRRLPE